MSPLSKGLKKLFCSQSIYLVALLLAVISILFFPANLSFQFIMLVVSFLIIMLCSVISLVGLARLREADEGFGLALTFTVITMLSTLVFSVLEAVMPDVQPILMGDNAVFNICSLFTGGAVMNACAKRMLALGKPQKAHCVLVCFFVFLALILLCVAASFIAPRIAESSVGNVLDIVSTLSGVAGAFTYWLALRVSCKEL